MYMQKTFNNISSYILLAAPVLVSSLFIYKSQFPAWANTLFLSLLLAFLISILNFRNLKNRKEVNLLSLAIIVLGVIASAIFVILDSQKISFALFGKGLTEWTGISILSLFVFAAYFVNTKSKKIIAIGVASIAIIYTVINFIFIKYLPSVAQYTGYLNIPMVSFSKLINYAFILCIIILAASLVNYFMEKKGYVFASIKSSVYVLALYIIVPVILFVAICSYTLRYIAAYNYIQAGQEYSAGNYVKARESINRAITISPFDVYYSGRIEMISTEIQTLLNSTSTDKQALEKKYKELVEYQISDAKKAVAYDPKNPSNYMALGLAYERSMLLTKEGGYKLAAEAYEQARAIAEDKDYVDVVKAKLSFSADKEQDALVSLDRALNYNASSAPALYIFSQYYALKKNLKSAIDYGEKTVAVAPNAVDARMHLGLLYLENNNIDGAIQLFGSAFVLSEQKDNAALYYLGLAYKEKKDIANLKLVLSELEKRVDPNLKEVKDLRSFLDSNKSEVKVEKKK